MLHLLPNQAPEPRPKAYAEAVSRLASIRHALRMVDPCAGPAPDLDGDDAVAAGFAQAAPAARRCFDRRSGRLVGATAAGVEVMLTELKAGREPHAQASAELVEQIRRELAEVSRLVLGPSTMASPWSPSPAHAGAD